MFFSSSRFDPRSQGESHVAYYHGHRGVLLFVLLLRGILLARTKGQGVEQIEKKETYSRSPISGHSTIFNPSYYRLFAGKFASLSS